MCVSCAFLCHCCILCEIKYIYKAHGSQSGPLGVSIRPSRSTRNVKNDRFVSITCVFSSSKICQNSFSVGALPQTPLGELTMLPQTPLPIPFPSTPLAPQLSGPDQFEICTLGPPVKKVEHSWINRAHVHAAIWNCSGHWTVHSSLQKK